MRRRAPRFSPRPGFHPPSLAPSRIVSAPLPLLWLLVALQPAVAASRGSEQEEAPRNLPVVRAEGDPIRALLQQIASPTLPEPSAQALFDQLVVRGAGVLPSLAAAFRDKQSDDTVVWIAGRALARIGGPGVRVTLTEGLSSSRVIGRLAAVSGLTILKDPSSAEALERALFDGALVVRSAAADALGVMGSRRSSTALSESLNVPGNFRDGQSLFVRFHIVAALGSIGSIGGIDALISVLDGQEPALQALAVASLEAITGNRFADPSAPHGAAPGKDEVSRWKSWWSQRKVAPPPQEIEPKD